MGTIPARTVAAGESAMVDVSSYFSDPAGDALSYTAASSSAGIATVSVSGSSITVTALARGVATITVTARDPQGLVAQQPFQVTVPNGAPEAVGAIPAQLIFVGQTASLDASVWFRDPDGDPLTYTATSSEAVVATVTIAAATVTIHAATTGVTTITVVARDLDGASVEQTIQVAVPNRGPEAVGTIPARIVSVGQSPSVDVSSYFTDPDGDALSYTAASSNDGIAAVSVSGDSVAVTALARGVVTITVTARDPRGLVAQQRFQVTVPNGAPETLGAIPDQAVFVGHTASLDASAWFRDPDGDSLTYTARSSDATVAEGSVSGSGLTVRGVASGTATVTVTASDPEGLSAASSFGVTVTSRSGFQIELVFATPVTRTQEAVFVRAAERWMTILASTELPDVSANRTLGCGGDPTFRRDVETIDDLMIVAAVAEIDGPHGTLAAATPCWVRSGTRLPFYGAMKFDVADLNRLERTGDLEDVILHEMGHVLGIGTVWTDLGLLRHPASDAESPDTHFTGALAIEAFNEAGGAGYRGAKVPVENTGGPGSRNGHWRQTVLGTELMTPYLASGDADPLSAITVQSLADLGYEVDLTLADPYRLPEADAARAIEPGRLIPYGDDILRGPIVVVDPDGRIVRVIPG